MANAPFPIPAHRTGRADLRHPALRLASPQGTRLGRPGQAFEAKHAAVTIDYVVGEPSGTTPVHLVPSGEEVAHALIDVIVDATEDRPMRPIGEVARPAEQKPVQRVAHIRPG